MFILTYTCTLYYKESPKWSAITFEVKQELIQIPKTPPQYALSFQSGKKKEVKGIEIEREEVK